MARIDEVIGVTSPTMLPLPLDTSLMAQCEEHLKAKIETRLKLLLTSLEQRTLTWEEACIGLGHIQGFYEVLSYVKQQREGRLHGGRTNPS